MLNVAYDPSPEKEFPHRIRSPAFISKEITAHSQIRRKIDTPKHPRIRGRMPGIAGSSEMRILKSYFV
jgi:hypothetical protein